MDRRLGADEAPTEFVDVSQIGPYRRPAPPRVPAPRPTVPARRDVRPWPPRPVSPLPRPSSQPPRIPKPPISRLGQSIRERLFGQQSIIFIVMMSIRIIWTGFQGIRSASDLRYTALALSIYFMAIFIASPYRRLRVPAIGLFCGLIWAYALVDAAELTSAAPDLWEAFVVMGVLAALIELAYSHMDQRVNALARSLSPGPASWLTDFALVILIVATLLFVMPVAIIVIVAVHVYGVDGSPLYKLVLVAYSLPPLVGLIAYGQFAIRRARDLVAVSA